MDSSSSFIFDYNGMFHQKFIQFIENTLIRHDCSKIHKFHLHYPYGYKGIYAQFAEKIAFATSKYVEDLNLSLSTEELLPEFLFNYASLVKLSARCFTFMPQVKVNWGCLSLLEITYSTLPNQALEHIVSGSPTHKSLKLITCITEEIVIASKSLKRLFIDFCELMFRISVVEISCPILEEFSLKGMRRVYIIDSKMLARAIENVVSGSLLLKSFELISCNKLDKLVVASKSLKKLVVRNIFAISSFIETSSPQLEELNLVGYVGFKTIRLLNLPSSLCATLDFYHPQYPEQNTCKRLIIEILQQLQYLKELKIGSWILQVLSTIKVGGQFSPVLNIKSLTLTSPCLVEYHSGIAHLLHISSVLEKLVIYNDPRYFTANPYIGKKYWDSNAAVFDCLVSHLKTIKIMDVPKEADRREHMLNLVKFLLKNARVLEKMVVLLGDRIGTSQSYLSQILLSLPRCSQNAIIEVL